MTSPIAVAVVIPAHDEEDLIGACLDAVHHAIAAARPLATRFSVHVSLDHCSDRTRSIALAAGVQVIDAVGRGVGAARAAGVGAALAHHAAVPLRRLWVAHTDADSVVPGNWLAHQWHLAAAGADVVVGTVRPDFRDLSPEQIAAW